MTARARSAGERLVSGVQRGSKKKGRNVMPKFAFIGVCMLGSLLPFAAHAAVTCAQVRCMAGTTCVEVRGGNAQCVATTSSSVTAGVTQEAEEGVSQQAVSTCAATTCAVGTMCIDTPRGARCVGSREQPQPEEEEESAGCLAMLCAAGTLCVETEQGAACLPIVRESSSSAVGQTGQASQTGQTGQFGQAGGTGPGNPTCAATLCAVGSRCIETGMGAVCVPFPEM